MPKLSIIEFLATRGSPENLHKIGIKKPEQLVGYLEKVHIKRLKLKKQKRQSEIYYSNHEENREKSRLRARQAKIDNPEKYLKQLKRNRLKNYPRDRTPEQLERDKISKAKWALENKDKKLLANKKWWLRQKLRPMFYQLIIYATKAYDK